MNTYYRMPHVLLQVRQDFEAQGFFQAQPGKGAARSQAGVMRVNCIDCLDRTNVVQGEGPGCSGLSLAHSDRVQSPAWAATPYVRHSLLVLMRTLLVGVIDLPVLIGRRSVSLHVQSQYH